MAHPTDESIERAREAGRARLASTPRAVAGRYEPATETLLLHLNNDMMLHLPVAKLQGVAEASESERSNVELLAFGTGLRFPDIDADFAVSALLEGIYGSAAWMQAIGAKGGRVRTVATQRASRRNGRKGGRPSERLPLRTYTGESGTMDLGNPCPRLVERERGSKRMSYWLKAANGRTLGTVRGSSDPAFGGVERFRELVTSGRVSITHARTADGYRIEITPREAGMVFRSVPYASKSTMSRGKSTILRALAGAKVESK